MKDRLQQSFDIRCLLVVDFQLAKITSRALAGAFKATREGYNCTPKIRRYQLIFSRDHDLLGSLAI